MANITVSNDIDTFLQAANNAAAKSALGINELANWEEDGTTLQPITGGYGIGTDPLDAGGDRSLGDVWIGNSGGQINTLYFRNNGPYNGGDGNSSRAISIKLNAPNENIEQFYVTGGGRVYSYGGVISTSFESSNNFSIGGGWGSYSRSVTGGLQGTGITSPYAISFAAGIGWPVAIVRGTNPQTFQVYNTYTDASNYERGFLKWDTNEFVIGTEALGTGSVRNLRLVTNNLLKVGTTSDDDQFLSISNSGYGDIRVGPVNSSSNGGGAVIIGAGAYVNGRGNGRLIAIGKDSTADSYGAIAIGSDSTRAMASDSIAIGNTANASGVGSVALGGAGKWGGSNAKRAAEISFPRFYGHSQHGFNYLNATTTDSNPVDFNTMHSTFFVSSNTAMCIKGQVIAKKTDHSLVEKWDVEATFLNDGTTLTMVSSSIDLKTPNTSGWTLVIAADNVNKTIKLTITAEATVKATASLHYIDQT